MLDLGYSIADMERLCAAQGIHVLSTYNQINKKVRQQPYYTTPGPAYARWLLVPSVDNGVLPESRHKCYDEQVQHMQEHHTGYVVGRIRELVTVAMLQYVKNDAIVFQDLYTYGRCKEQFKNGDWLGYRVSCIDPRSDRGGILVFGDVEDARENTGLFGVLTSDVFQ